MKVTPEQALVLGFLITLAGGLLSILLIVLAAYGVNELIEWLS